MSGNGRFFVDLWEGKEEYVLRGNWRIHTISEVKRKKKLDLHRRKKKKEEKEGKYIDGEKEGGGRQSSGGRSQEE